jgi:hypothetical protein
MLSYTPAGAIQLAIPARFDARVPVRLCGYGDIERR